METIYQVGHWTQFQQTKKELRIENLDMSIFFGEKDGKLYAIIAEYKRRGPYRSCGHWHSGSGLYNVYYRVNFHTRDDGNRAYARVKSLFDSFRIPYSGCCECHGYVSYEQIKNALCA